eukprot:TRINITY_DN1344_c0_g2_i1.p1 TRINITY_DN1344_c0_g2~~TRINITY_DN1344_c0_g2_i1.p1  ORF type:complete len:718 (+),score=151.36 TRINITY_DN1344_c0_g2_i1:85-2154(+)
MSSKNFTETQKNEIYELVQQALSTFVEENKEEISLLKSLLANPKIPEILSSLKSATTPSKITKEKKLTPKLPLEASTEEEEGSKQAAKPNTKISPVRRPGPIKPSPKKPNLNISHEAPVISPQRIPPAKVKPLPQTTRAKDGKKFEFGENAKPSKVQLPKEEKKHPARKIEKKPLEEEEKKVKTKKVPASSEKETKKLSKPSAKKEAKKLVSKKANKEVNEEAKTEPEPDKVEEEETEVAETVESKTTEPPKPEMIEEKKEPSELKIAEEEKEAPQPEMIEEQKESSELKIAEEKKETLEAEIADEKKEPPKPEKKETPIIEPSIPETKVEEKDKEPSQDEAEPKNPEEKKEEPAAAPELKQEEKVEPKVDPTSIVQQENSAAPNAFVIDDSEEPPKATETAPQPELKLNPETAQSIEKIAPQGPIFKPHIRYFLPPDISIKLGHGVSELKKDTAEEILDTLKWKKSEIDFQIKTIEESSPDFSKPVGFDIGLKDTFLEVEQTDEVNQFYALNKPSPETLLVAKILAGLLGKWDLVNPEDSEITWARIKAYFAGEMKDNISIFCIPKLIGTYFLEKIKGQQLDFSPENLFKLKQLIKGQSFEEQLNLGESGSIDVLYLAVVDPALRAIGAVEKGEPFFVWSELRYEAGIVQTAIDNLSKALAKQCFTLSQFEKGSVNGLVLIILMQRYI